MLASRLSLAMRSVVSLWPGGFVRFNPEFRDRLRALGLRRPHDFLDLPGEVVGGHTDRHVMLVAIGDDVGYLKREHRVHWADRWASLFAGLGPVSLAEREAARLSELRAAGVPVPDWLAFGKDAAGRAFLLVRAIPGARDLRSFLNEERSLSARNRRALARALGRAIGRAHRAGFDWPDLSCKHVLVEADGVSVCLIDWPQSHHCGDPPMAERLRELAALRASVAGGLTAPRDRLVFLRAYLDAAEEPRMKLGTLAREAERVAGWITGQRRFRELRQPPVPPQRLRWLDGEALCVTRRFWQMCRGDVPGWLRTAATKCVGRTEASVVKVPEFGPGRLTIYPPWAWYRRLSAGLIGHRPQSVGAAEAGRLFRLERFGVPAVTALAFGQRPDGGGFLLTEFPSDATPLRSVRLTPELTWAAEDLRRRLREAGYECASFSDDVYVTDGPAGRPRMFLSTAENLKKCG